MDWNIDFASLNTALQRYLELRKFGHKQLTALNIEAASFSPAPSQPTHLNTATRGIHSTQANYRLNDGVRPPPVRSIRPLKNNKRRVDVHQEARSARKDTGPKDFNKLVSRRLESLRSALDDDATAESVALDRNSLRNALSDYSRSVLESMDGDGTPGIPSSHTLRNAFATKDTPGIDSELRLAFFRRAITSTFSEADLKKQKHLADMRYPEETYPFARAIQRKIHLHVGPTNSGKTYQALKKLEEAETGVYAGPLRLLAHEVYNRLIAKGKRCDLITGDEQILCDNEKRSLSSCTVEMIPTSRDLDVAVIDEIQMLGDDSRGWAWTHALLGVRAKEIHVCGEERAVPLVRDLIAATGDDLEIHRYNRLSPLVCMEKSLESNLSNLRKGDCVVVFSRVGLHYMKREIEQKTRKRCAIVYGNLPPHTRAQQAALFNDPSNDFDFLVASDAIGMGLNLNIKRIILESTQKFDGTRTKTIPISDIKQIAGRAGRYKTTTDDSLSEGVVPKPSGHEGGKHGAASASRSNVGLVTTLDQVDLRILQVAMSSDAAPLSSAGWIPSDSVIRRFAEYFRPQVPFGYILTRLNEIAQTHPNYHLCSHRDRVHIANLIQPIKGLSLTDKLTLCTAPLRQSEEAIFKALASCIGEQQEADPLRMHEFDLELLDTKVGPSRQYLISLESLHRGLTLYLWLSYRFAGVFRSRDLVFHIKGLVEEKIDEVLGQVHFNRLVRKYKTKSSPEVMEWLDNVKKQWTSKGQEALEGNEAQANVAWTSLDLGERPQTQVHQSQ
ncbi:MAG: hypothetical protein M4579_005609 [Chaenotheca gracillima]|nr:MAG: hypothetical protein M4579_005609 [Chaenotheca gracillima]